MKKRYFAIPILAIALHFLLSNLLYFLVERLVLDVFHIPSQQFMKHSYWGEILIYAVLILVFFTLYNLLWRKDISEPRTATNFKDVLGSLVVGFGICGISGLWIMLAEQLPSLQKSVEAMNAGTENIAGGNAFGTFMIAVIAAPVVEEILFRGIVLRSMRKFAPAWAAILISSVLFGVYHLNIVQAAYATLMGIAAGILYERKRNLLFPILVHFANNLIKLIDFVKGHNHIAGLRYGRPGLFLLGLRRCGLFGCGDGLGGLRGNILRRASIQFFIGHLRSSFSLKLHKFER